MIIVNISTLRSAQGHPWSTGDVLQKRDHSEGQRRAQLNSFSCNDRGGMWFELNLSTPFSFSNYITASMQFHLTWLLTSTQLRKTNCSLECKEYCETFWFISSRTRCMFCCSVISSSDLSFQDLVLKLEQLVQSLEIQFYRRRSDQKEYQTSTNVSIDFFLRQKDDTR